MKALSRFMLLAFFITLLIDIIAIELKWLEWRFFSKPLLMPLLALWLVFGKAKDNISRRMHLFYLLLTALFFSWLGDIFLHLDIFVIGLLCFLVAHLVYIIRFFRFVPRPNVKNIFLAFPIILLCAFFLGDWLSEEAREMRSYIFIYACAILTMLSVVLMTQPRSKILILGANLFVLSDLILAIGKYKYSFPLQNSLVMLTYGLAQFLIVLDGKKRKY